MNYFAKLALVVVLYYFIFNGLPHNHTYTLYNGKNDAKYST